MNSKDVRDLNRDLSGYRQKIEDASTDYFYLLRENPKLDISQEGKLLSNRLEEYVKGIEMLEEELSRLEKELEESEDN